MPSPPAHGTQGLDPCRDTRPKFALAASLARTAAFDAGSALSSTQVFPISVGCLPILRRWQICECAGDVSQPHGDARWDRVPPRRPASDCPVTTGAAGPRRSSRLRPAAKADEGRAEDHLRHHCGRPSLASRWRQTSTAFHPSHSSKASKQRSARRLVSTRSQRPIMSR